MPADMLDLNAYLARIGLPDLGRPSLETLRALVAHHAAAIPFENLDVVLGRPVPLEPAAIQSKLVRRKRGGYCFEHNTLLHTVLRRLGFDAVMLMGRVVLGADETAERPRTHAFVQVRLPEGTWLADVGFGNLTPTTPLSLAHQETQATPHEAYRVRQRDHGLVLQVWLHDDWRPVYRFTLEPTLPIDHVVANWFTSTCPGGMFTSNLVVAMPAQGCRKTLFNGLLTVRQLEGGKQTRMISSVTDLRATLGDVFDLEVGAEDAERLFIAMRRFADNANPALRVEG